MTTDGIPEYAAIKKQDPAAYAEMAAEREGLIEVTYRRVTGNWVVVSGYQKGQNGVEIFYERAQFNGDRSVVAAIVLTYPKSGREIYDPLVGAISKSLTTPRPD